MRLGGAVPRHGESQRDAESNLDQSDDNESDVSKSDGSAVQPHAGD